LDRDHCLVIAIACCAGAIRRRHCLSHQFLPVPLSVAGAVARRGSPA
jgi:hypothetical protein